MQLSGVSHILHTLAAHGCQSCLLGCRQGRKDASHLVPQQLSLALKADDILEVTLTQAVMESFTAAQNVLSDVMLVVSEPQVLEEVVVTHEGPDTGGDTLYWLQNLTDVPVEFWTRGPGQSHRALPLAFKPSELGLLQFSLDCTTSWFRGCTA